MYSGAQWLEAPFCSITPTFSSTPSIMPAPSTVKLLRSKDSTLIFAEATGNYSNPHVVLLAGLTLSGCAFDDFCSDQRLLDALYIVCAPLYGRLQLIYPAV